ncbi:hypothetical protein G7054_g8322 [Neopestalotiopsis clavispora]|nr:hypothetical protein G7054_g8322 [Neopestalotiopsis clavispora]
MFTKGDPQFVVLRYQAWLDASKYENIILGAIVKNPLSPSTNYAMATKENTKSDDAEHQTDDAKYQTGNATDFLLENESTRGNDSTASVSRLAGFNMASKKEDREKLAGKFIRFKRIEQLDDFWGTLKSNEAVSKKALNWVAKPGPYPPCLVVGIMVCEDVDLYREGLRSREIGGKIELPIGQIALGAGAPIALGEEANPKASLSSSKQNATVFSAKFGEKKIFALELRTITTHLFKRRQLQLKNHGPEFDPARLAGDGGPDVDINKPAIAEDLILDYFDDNDIKDLIR